MFMNGLMCGQLRFVWRVALLLCVMGIMYTVSRFLVNAQVIALEQFINNFLIGVLGSFTINFQIGLSERNFPAGLVIFYTIMVVALIRFRFSEGKENGWLRFSFALLLICAFKSIIWMFVYVYEGVKGSVDSGLSDYLVLLVFKCVMPMILVVISWKCLVVLNTNIIIKSEGRDGYYFYQTTSKFNRFVHFIIDTILIINIFFPLVFAVFYFVNRTFNEVESIFDNKYMFFVIFFFCSCVYYVFFEYFFGSTPAKFITQTKVADEDDNLKLPFKKVLIRSLSRHIPFNVFSFIFSYTGWHDSISYTRVVKEERSSSRVWNIVVLFLVILILVLYYFYHFIFDIYYYRFNNMS